MIAIQAERFRYNDGSEELYDHSTDLDEIHNLAGNPEFDKVKVRLGKFIPTKQRKGQKPLWKIR